MRILDTCKPKKEIKRARNWNRGRKIDVKGQFLEFVWEIE